MLMQDLLIFVINSSDVSDMPKKLAQIKKTKNRIILIFTQIRGRGWWYRYLFDI